MSDMRCRGCWHLDNNCGLCGHCIETRPSAPPLIPWMLCVRDRHGAMTGQMGMATLEGLDWLAELEGGPFGVRWCGDRERVESKGLYKRAPYMLKVYGNGRLPVWRHRACVGNIHWDAAGIPARHSVMLLRWMRHAGWRMTAGPTPLFDAFNGTEDGLRTLRGMETFDAAVMAAMGIDMKTEDAP